MRITQVLVLGLIGTALPVQFAIADADGERAVLAQDQPRAPGDPATDNGGRIASQSRCPRCVATTAGDHGS